MQICDTHGGAFGEPLILDAVESIVKVEACRGGRYVYVANQQHNLLNCNSRTHGASLPVLGDWH